MKKIWSFICICAFFSTIGNSTLIKPHIDEFLLRHYSQPTKAVIIDELLEVDPSYIYLFKINGVEYKNREHKNNAADSTLKVGNTIEVEYYKYNPSINRLLHFKH